MNKKLVNTKNVKEFVGFMEELKSLPPNIPKIALVYGDYGLGKSETIKWWTFKNDCVYVRANKGMSVRWLLYEISEELQIKLFGCLCLQQSVFDEKKYNNFLKSERTNGLLTASFYCFKGVFFCF